MLISRVQHHYSVSKVMSDKKNKRVEDGEAFREHVVNYREHVVFLFYSDT